jgi:tetratricopeptide (TPR) repeat protein
MARAEAGQILSTEIVLERSRTTFETTPIEPFKAKGKAELVKASLVGPIAGRRSGRVADTPFVGREREVETLRAVLDDVQAGNGWTVEIAGPSGIGKTRLLTEVLAAAPNVRVLRSTCEEYEASTPYYALRAAMREVVGLDPGTTPAAQERRLRKAVAAADRELVPWVPLLGILLGLDLPATPETKTLDERFLAEVLADVTQRFLVATLGNSPVALVVEDAQFMDDSSAGLLHRLSKEWRSLPYALIVARTMPEGLWTDMGDEELRFLAFDLLPLSEREASQIVEIATDEEPLRPHEVEELARRSGGSPLFLVELLNVARTTGTIEALPDSVEAVVTADIDRLGASDRIVLRYASVLGVTFDETLLRATLRHEVEVDETLWERLRGLVERDLATGRLYFRNTLVHDAAYEGLPFRRRRELHGRVAEAIVAAATSLEDEAATLALHYSAAGRHAETWHYARLGGDRARAVAANVEAARLYDLALSSGRFVRTVTPRDRAQVLESLGTICDFAGLFDQSFDALRRATGLLADAPTERSRLFMRRARARFRTGAYGPALRETARGLLLVEGRGEPDAVAARASLRAMRGEIRSFQGHARAAIALAELAIDEAQRVDELETLAHAYAVLDGSYQALGEPAKAVHEWKALEIYTMLGRLRSRGITELNLGVQAYADGRWNEALDLYQRALDDCAQAGDRQSAAIAGANLGELLVSRGELDEAEQLLGNARRVLRASGMTAFALFAEMQLARCELERGEAAKALELLESLVDAAQTVGHSLIVLELNVWLAHAHALAGSPQIGLDTLDTAAAAAGDEAVLHAAPVDRARAACLLALARPLEARTCLERALEAARAQGLVYEELLARRALADLAEGVTREELREHDRLAQLLRIASSGYPTPAL